MPGRHRRVRLLTISLFAFFAFLLYTRSGAPAEEYKDIFADKLVGGGSVIRPSLDDIPPQKQPPPPPDPNVIDEQDQIDEEEPDDDLDDDTPSTTITESPELPAETPVTQEPTPTTTEPAPKGYSPDQEVLDQLDGVGHGRMEESEASSSSTTTPTAHWTKQSELFPVSTTMQLPKGTSIAFPRIQRAEKKLKENGADREKLAKIKATAQHAWDKYKEVAFGADETKPLSGGPHNPFNGWGATLVDSLDTLWIMGMTDEFDDAVKKVAKIDFTTSTRADIPLFETTIRYLGGMIAAFDISGREEKYRVLLDKAVELAEVLYSAFDTPNRMPETFYHWDPAYTYRPHKSGTRAVMSELGSLSMEFTRLAQLTKEPKYYDAIARITDAFEEFQNRTRLSGMWPTHIDASGCNRDATTPYTISKSGSQQPLDNGNTASVAAGAPVQAKSEQITSSEDEAKGLSADGPTKGNHPSVGKIKGWGDPIDEVTGKPASAGDGPLEDLGATKKLRRRHQLESYDSLQAVDSLESTEGVVADNETQPSLEIRTPTLRPRPNFNDDGEEECVPQGLESSSKTGTETYTLSGLSDSTYEYLPKEYMLLGGLVDKYKTMFLDSADTIIENLIYKPMTPDQRDILMSGEVKISLNLSDPDNISYIKRPNPEVAHLACFAGGMFAMAGVIFDKPEHVEIGSKLTDGCVWAYNSTATGIMPEGGVLMPCPDTWGKCEWNETAYYLELDPYASSRTVPAKIEGKKPVKDDLTEDTTSASPSRSAAAPASPAEETDDVLVGPGSKPDLIKKTDGTTRDRSDSLRKRDLDEAPSRVSESAPEPVEARSPAAIPAVDDDDDMPILHREYVEQKIEEENLPPGFLRISGRNYILRPEAIESVVYMYRITGDTYWRDAGWTMFRAIDRHTRAPYGAATLYDVTDPDSKNIDSQESFWLAETLKYFYLLYDDPDLWSFDDWVLNTEAHFFRRPKYNYAPTS